MDVIARVDAALALPPRAIRARVGALLGRGGTEREWRDALAVGTAVGHLHEPARGSGKAVVLVADAACPSRVFDGFRMVVGVAELVGRGWRVVHFDPPGVGASPGEDDVLGPATAAALGAAVRRAAEGGSLVGVVAFGAGAAGAIAGIARDPEWGSMVHFLVDVDGPTDRKSLAARLRARGLAVPSLDDDAWWEARDPFYNVDALPCPYYRIQPNDSEGGLELVNGALNGKAGWARLNDNQPNQQWYNWRPEDNLRLSPAGFSNRNRWLLGLLEQAFHTDYPADRKARRMAEAPIGGG